MNQRLPEPGPHEAAQLRELQGQAEAALRELPPKSRAVLQLHYREGLTHAEVAAALGIARGTVKSRLSRALGAMRHRLASSEAAPSVAEVSALLAALPGPKPTAALLDACTAKAAAAGTASASSLLALKAAAAVFIVGTATLVFVHSISSETERSVPAARDTLVRAESMSDRARAPRDAAAASGWPDPAPDRPTSSDPADPGGGATAEPTGERPGHGTQRDGRRHGKLPEGAQIVRGDGTDQPLRSNIKPGRFQPLPRNGERRGSKYAPPPGYRGESVVSGRVLDAAGTPVEGAEVYRMPLDTDREATTVVSYEFLTKIATTDKEGEFVAERQAHGTFLLVANFQRCLNRPGGMETRDAIVVRLQERDRTENLLLQLPFNVGEFVALRGVVSDAEGRPVRGAQVFVDYQECRTGADGRFDAGRVPVGEHAVVVHRLGYKALETEVVADRGRENVARLMLEFEETGELRLAGQVLDTRGRPVANAVVYLNADVRTVRRVSTDGTGEYAFEKLPQRLEKSECSVNVSAAGYFPRRVDDVRVPADPFEIRIERAYPLVLKVISDATGEPLPQTRGEARREDTTAGPVKYRVFLTWSSYREGGVHDDLLVPAGNIQLEVEAPGHAATTVAFEIAPDEEPREVVVRLPIAPEKPEDE
jgi:protocatechuate 3,4-dioxygenase beta subunit